MGVWPARAPSGGRRAGRRLAVRYLAGCAIWRGAQSGGVRNLAGEPWATPAAALPSGPGLDRPAPLDPPVGPTGHGNGPVTGVHQSLGGSQAAAANGTDDVQRVTLGNLVLAGGQIGQRDQDRTGDVGGLVLVGVADVEDGGAGAMSPGEGVQVDLEQWRISGHDSIVVRPLRVETRRGAGTSRRQGPSCLAPARALAGANGVTPQSGREFGVWAWSGRQNGLKYRPEHENAPRVNRLVTDEAIDDETTKLRDDETTKLRTGHLRVDHPLSRHTLRRRPHPHYGLNRSIRQPVASRL
jgi:hypothetical protein